MKAFADLYTALDETTATSEKIAALVAYFRTAPPRDAAWAVHFLSGRRPKRLVGPREAAGMGSGGGRGAGLALRGELPRRRRPGGDHHAPPARLRAASSDRPLAEWVESRLLELRGQDDAVQRQELVRAWRELGRRERYVWNKLLTGSFRVGASARLVVQALAEVSGVDEGTIAHRLMGAWEPTA